MNYRAQQRVILSRKLDKVWVITSYLNNMVESKIHTDALLLTTVRNFWQSCRKFSVKSAANVRLIRRQHIARPPQRAGQHPTNYFA
jgi:hypothetical protein